MAGDQGEKKPAGGYDPSRPQRKPPGYTVKITFHRATRLPLADFASLSSDPYVKAQLYTSLPSRHKEDPPITFRTRTVWHNTEPEWEQEWVLAHVPADGFRIKARLYDEDSRDGDDRLGNAHIAVGPIDENWQGIHNQPFKIMKRAGSWRAYALRAVAAAMQKEKRLGGALYVSVDLLGKSPGNDGGRAYTVGLQYWCQNYSPLFGRIAGSKAPDVGEEENQDYKSNHTTSPTLQSPTHAEGQQKPSSADGSTSSSKQRQRYNFQSNQMQLQGPVPDELYHRYVEFRPFVKAMYTRSGIQGFILSKALHHQHANIYNFNKSTRYGCFNEPCAAMTRQFFDLAHWDEGGRIYTYVITLDGLLRFTETGKEFGIDLLSKHTMHSDVSIYIAYSGEFFIRKASQHAASDSNEKVDGEEPKREPVDYEIVIDNDSGTYRPNAEKLPILREFLQRNFPGPNIRTLDCQKDEEVMNKLKNEQREKKNASRKGRMVFAEASRSSSVSSGADARLDQVAQAQQNGTTGEPKHAMGEALGPYVKGEHMRKLIGANA